MGLCYCPGKHVGSMLPGATNRKKVRKREVDQEANQPQHTTSRLLPTIRLGVVQRWLLLYPRMPSSPRFPIQVWTRDLNVDLIRLRDHFGVTTVVCLLSEVELRCLKVREYATCVLAHHLQYVTLPMIEMAAPDSFDDACALVADLRRRIERGEVLAVGHRSRFCFCAQARLSIRTAFSQLDMNDAAVSANPTCVSAHRSPPDAALSETTDALHPTRHGP